MRYQQASCGIVDLHQPCRSAADRVGALVLFSAGRVSGVQVGVALELLPALAFGARLSHLVHHRVEPRFLRAFVFVLSLASSMLLLGRAVA